ncbi:hypothetical protein BX600DRAFT_471548 [Xylariales sp. PMI_506]|nr:hypothetical protein BX600DRAFT_471548 [Xylariales sp. PMI_506]
MAPSFQADVNGDGNGDEDQFRADVTARHMASLGTFVESLNKAAKNILHVSRAYNRVAGVVTYWSPEVSDRGYLKQHGTELWKVFNNDYGFEVGKSPFELPNTPADRPQNNLLSMIQSVVFTGGISSATENNLFILYYGGHATEDGWWQPKVKSRTRLRWDLIQSVLAEADCDILFIFDCCYGGDMVDSENTWRRRCELLCSTPPGEEASGIEQQSFTRALVQKLKEERKYHNGCEVITLHSILNDIDTRDTFNLTRDPWFMPYSKPGTQISLQPAKDKASGLDPLTPARLRSLSDARVLLKVSFSNPADNPLIKEWERFVRNRPGNILKMKFFVLPKTDTKLLSGKQKAPDVKEREINKIIQEETKMIAAFEARSNAAIMSIPLWLWDLLDPHPAIEFITVVRSNNLIADMLKPKSSRGDSFPIDESDPKPPASPTPMPVTSGKASRGNRRGSSDIDKYFKEAPPFTLQQDWFGRMVKASARMDDPRGGLDSRWKQDRILRQIGAL